MSTAYFIVLDHESPGFDPFVNGKALAKAADQLDALCARKGIRRLASFVSQSPESLADLLGEEYEMPADAGADVAWFDAELGFSTCQEMVDALRAEPAPLPSTEKVIADLEEYKVVLSKAKAIGAKWHLEIDF